LNPSVIHLTNRVTISQAFCSSNYTEHTEANALTMILVKFFARKT
jgi:hypothetical protein